jgi:uncharacterized protein YqhQ
MRKFDIQQPMQVGGQAVIEGVMMRVPGNVTTAVRRSDGSIAIRTDGYVSLAEKFTLMKLPILRGAVGLVEMMIIGIQTLNFSAEVALAGEWEKDESGAPREHKRSSGIGIGITVGFSLLIGIAIFFVTPLVIATALFSIDQDPLAFNLVAGLIRIGLLLGYLGFLSLLPDIRRLFEYHGAEHKAVFTFERGLPLIVSSAATQSRFHPRCGTSFLLVVMVSAILLFSIVDTVYLATIGPITLLTRILVHIPLIPLVGGLSYEAIRFSAKHSETFLGKLAVAPGLWLQHITTREPDESQLEVALASLRAALGEPALTDDSRGLKPEVRQGYA